MAHGHGQVHRAPPSRQPRDSHCSPAHSREFAPSRTEPRQSPCGSLCNISTGNRFSILAELDQQPSQTKWAFDFVQAPSPTARRRGKRGAKNGKLKFTTRPPRETVHKSESESTTEEICKKMTALSLDGSNTHKKPPQSAFDFPPADGGDFCLPQSHLTWRDQSSPATVSPTIKFPSVNTQISPPAGRCILKAGSPSAAGELPGPDIKLQEPRFFPLSAFLATPDAARHPKATPLPVPAPVATSTTRKQPSAMLTTTAQKAAASAACRALATQIPHPSTTPLDAQRSGQGSVSLESPLAPTAESSPGPRLPITPSMAASPTLTTLPAISAVPPLTSLKSGVPYPSTLLSQPPPEAAALAPHPQLTPSTTSVIQGGIPKSTHSPALPTNLPRITSPMAPLNLSVVSRSRSPCPLTRPYVLPVTPLVSLPTSNSRPSKAALSIAIPERPQRPIPPPVSMLTNQILGITGSRTTNSETTQEEINKFLRKGHARQCWCKNHEGNHHKPTAPGVDRTPTSPVKVEVEPTTPACPVGFRIVIPTQRQDEEEEPSNPFATPQTPILSDSGFESAMAALSPVHSLPMVSIDQQYSAEHTLDHLTTSGTETSTFSDSELDSILLSPSFSSGYGSEFEDLGLDTDLRDNRAMWDLGNGCRASDDWTEVSRSLRSEDPPTPYPLPTPPRSPPPQPQPVKPPTPSPTPPPPSSASNDQVDFDASTLHMPTLVAGADPVSPLLLLPHSPSADQANEGARRRSDSHGNGDATVTPTAKATPPLETSLLALLKQRSPTSSKSTDSALVDQVLETFRGRLCREATGSATPEQTDPITRTAISKPTYVLPGTHITLGYVNSMAATDNDTDKDYSPVPNAHADNAAIPPSFAAYHPQTEVSPHIINHRTPVSHDEPIKRSQNPHHSDTDNQDPSLRSHAPFHQHDVNPHNEPKLWVTARAKQTPGIPEAPGGSIWTGQPPQGRQKVMGSKLKVGSLDEFPPLRDAMKRGRTRRRERQSVSAPRAEDREESGSGKWKRE